MNERPFDAKSECGILFQMPTDGVMSKKPRVVCDCQMDRDIAQEVC